MKIKRHHIIICAAAFALLAAVAAVAVFSSGSQMTVSCATGTANNFEYVDMGLSVKWARCNLGATAPEEYGGLFAWGEISEKEDFSWENYRFYLSGDVWSGNMEFSKYSVADGRSTLEPDDDAARQILGGEWRIPTSDEIKELIDNCSFTEVKLNGIKGMALTSRINGNSIFLPFAGSLEQIGSFGTGRYGNYWSSDLDKKHQYCAYILYLTNKASLFSYGRCAGFSVRPVF